MTYDGKRTARRGRQNERLHEGGERKNDEVHDEEENAREDLRTSDTQETKHAGGAGRGACTPSPLLQSLAKDAQATLRTPSLRYWFG
eukprot:4986660-Pyramimonas_sp.AAC.1